MGTHNICFYGEISKIIPYLSSNTHFTCFTDAMINVQVNEKTQLILRREIGL